MTPLLLDRLYFALCCLAIGVLHWLGSAPLLIVEVILALYALDFLYRHLNRLLRELRGEWVLGCPFAQNAANSRRRPVALVTGGALGLGKALAAEYVARGYSVVLWDINATALEATKAELTRTAAGSVLTAVVDVSSDTAVADAAKQLPEIDLLILNAGVVVGKRMADASARDIERVFSINVFQLFHAGRHIVPKMLHASVERRVVVIGSVAGYKGVAFVGDYNGSKAASNVFAEALSSELRGTNVGVTLVCPYVIDTGMFHGMTPLGLVPMLTVQSVVDAVVNAVEWQKHLVVIPWSIYLLNVIPRILPMPVFNLIDRLMGGSTAMKTFKGSTSSKTAK